MYTVYLQWAGRVRRSSPVGYARRHRPATRRRCGHINHSVRPSVRPSVCSVLSWRAVWHFGGDIFASLVVTAKIRLRRSARGMHGVMGVCLSAHAGASSRQISNESPNSRNDNEHEFAYCSLPMFAISQTVTQWVDRLDWPLFHGELLTSFAAGPTFVDWLWSTVNIVTYGTRQRQKRSTDQKPPPLSVNILVYYAK